MTNEAILLSKDIYNSTITLHEEAISDREYYMGRIMDVSRNRYTIKINGHKTTLLNIKLVANQYASQLRIEDAKLLETMAHSVYNYLCDKIQQSPKIAKFLQDYRGGDFTQVNGVVNKNELNLRSELDFDSGDYNPDDALKIYLHMINSRSYYYNYISKRHFDYLIKGGEKIFKIIDKVSLESEHQLYNIFNPHMIGYGGEYADNKLKLIPKLHNDSTEYIGDNEAKKQAYYRLAQLSFAMEYNGYKIPEDSLVKNYEIDDKTLYVVKDYNRVKTNYCALPIKSPKFCEKILELTIGDIIKVYPKIGRGSTLTSALKIIDEVLEDEGATVSLKESFNEANKLAYTLNGLVIAHSNDVELAKIMDTKDTLLTSTIYAKGSYYNALKILNDYFKEVKIDNFNTTIALDQVNTLLSFTGKWFKGPKINSENILANFYKVANAEKIIKTISRVKNSDYTFTENQWRKFLENYGEYESMPIDWIYEMVK